MQGHDTERIKNNDGLWECQCVQCGKIFTSKRYDASFCKPRCRVAYSREPQKRENAMQELIWMGKRANQIASKYHTDNDVYETILGMKKAIEYALSKFEEEQAK